VRSAWLLLAVLVVGSAALGVAFGGQQGAVTARSEAGLEASSLTVPGVPTPPIPEGNTGLAAKYPGDVGIEKDPDVVFVADFEGSVDEICSHWDQVAGQPIMSKSDEVPPGSGGRQSLLLTRVAGGTNGYTGGGKFSRWLKDEQGNGYDQLFYRVYMKFNKEHAPIHHYGSGLSGSFTPYAHGGAGKRPKGDQLWSTNVEPGNFKTWGFYTYWQQMGGSPPRGQTWGNLFEADVPPRPVEKDKWVCVELMVKMNDIGDTNGEQAYWIDGKLSRKGDMITSYLGKGFPSVGTWTHDRFHPGLTTPGKAWNYQEGRSTPIPGGKPFPGFAWRTIPELNINGMWLYRYMDAPETGTSKVWWDHVVVAKKYIGPLTPVNE